MIKRPKMLLLGLLMLVVGFAISPFFLSGRIAIVSGMLIGGGVRFCIFSFWTQTDAIPHLTRHSDESTVSPPLHAR